MRLSIIVPVYNVERYIIECIESLLKIPSYDMEIIVVNDGTKDRSIDLLRDYTDNRLKLINRINGGLSAARNTGLDKAKGKYILFIDSDDFIINQKEILNMLDIAEKNKCDVVIGNGYRYLENGRKLPIRRPKCIFQKSLYSGKEYLEKILLNNSFTQVVWLNLYSKDFLEKENLKFKEGIYHEDLHFTPIMLSKAKMVGVSKQYFYIYRQRGNSIMTKKGQLKNANDIFEITEEVYKEFKNIDNNRIKQKVSEMLAENLFSAICRGKNEKKDFLDVYKIRLLNNCINDSRKINIKIIGRLLNINENIGCKAIEFQNDGKIIVKKLLRR